MITRRGPESCAGLGCCQLRTEGKIIFAAYTSLSNFVQALLAGREITIRLSCTRPGDKQDGLEAEGSIIVCRHHLISPIHFVKAISKGI